jgi:hypothetical protein
MALVEDAKQEIVFSYLSVGLHQPMVFVRLYRGPCNCHPLVCIVAKICICIVWLSFFSDLMSFLLFYENQQKITADSWCFSVRKVSDKNRCTQAHTLSLERIQSHCLLVGLSRLQNYLSLKRSDNNKDAPNDWIRKHIRTWKVQWFKS